LELKKVNISFATPYPGTKMYEECVENHLIEKKTTALLSNEALYYNSDTPHFKPYQLEKQDLIDFRMRVYQELDMQDYLDYYEQMNQWTQTQKFV